MSKLKKFSLAALFLVLSGAYLSHKLDKALHREDLINESILHLPSRNVQVFSNNGERKNSLENDNRQNTGKTIHRPYVPPEGKVTITPKDPKKKLEEVINIKYDTYGWVSANEGWGLKAGMVGGSGYFGLDKKFFYLNRWGIVGGIGYRTDYNNKGITPDLGVSYRLDTGIFHNTELCVSYVPLPMPTGFLGFRINL